MRSKSIDDENKIQGRSRHASDPHRSKQDPSKIQARSKQDPDKTVKIQARSIQEDPGKKQDPHINTSKIQARSKQGPSKIQARSKQDPGKIQANLRSTRDPGKIHARSRQDPSKIQARSK